MKANRLQYNNNEKMIPEPPEPYKSSAALIAELESNNKFFDSIVDMIPAKLYIAGNTGDEMYNPKYRKGQHKESKEARRARNKEARAAKFDPSRAETTLQAKRRKETEESDDDDSDSDLDTGSNNIGIEMDDDDENDVVQDGVQKSSIEAQKDTDGLSRINILREKLRAKIAEKQGSRPSSSGATSKRAARRAEKQKRVEAAKKRKEAGGSGFSSANQNRSNDKKKIDVDRIKKALSKESIQEDLSGIDFGGIAGLSKKEYYKDNKSLENINKKKNLVQLLKQAEEKQKRLEELKASENEADKEKAKRIQWGDTLKEAT